MERFNLFQDRIEGDISKVARIEKLFEMRNNLLEALITADYESEDPFNQLTCFRFQLEYCKEDEHFQLLIDNNFETY